MLRRNLATTWVIDTHEDMCKIDNSLKDRKLMIKDYLQHTSWGDMTELKYFARNNYQCDFLVLTPVDKNAIVTPDTIKDIPLKIHFAYYQVCGKERPASDTFLTVILHHANVSHLGPSGKIVNEFTRFDILEFDLLTQFQCTNEDGALNIDLIDVVRSLKDLEIATFNHLVLKTPKEGKVSLKMVKQKGKYKFDYVLDDISENEWFSTLSEEEQTCVKKAYKYLVIPKKVEEGDDLRYNVSVENVMDKYNCKTKVYIVFNKLSKIDRTKYIGNTTLKMLVGVLCVGHSMFEDIFFKLCLSLTGKVCVLIVHLYFK